jgi:hypothetical protein
VFPLPSVNLSWLQCSLSDGCHKHLGQFRVLRKALFETVRMFPEWSACFTNVASATFTGNAVDAVFYLLLTFLVWWLWANFWDWVLFWRLSWCCNNSLSIWNHKSALHIENKHRTKRLFLIFWATASSGLVKKWVSEPLGITIEPKITSEVVSFIEQVLSFLTYDRSSTVQALNC